jgi:hypothetical protein
VQRGRMLPKRTILFGEGLFKLLFDRPVLLPPWLSKGFPFVCCLIGAFLFLTSLAALSGSSFFSV